MQLIRILAVAMITVSTIVPAIASETISVDVGFDRWMYPFNITPGTRATGSVFGAIGESGFDNRDAQIVFGFDLSTIQPTPPNEQLASVTLSVTVAANNNFRYDPTFDTLDTYNGGADADAGRPLELYGVGTRNGFTGLTLDDLSTDPELFREGDPFTTQSEVNGTRSAFAADYAGGVTNDISNNVLENFEVVPWAIGQVAVPDGNGSDGNGSTIAPGDLVPINTAFNFSLDLGNTHVNAYVQSALAADEVYFALSSLHGATQGGPATYPSFYLDAGGVSLGATATLEFEFVPPNELLGDMNGDSIVDEADAAAFILALTDPAQYQLQYPAVDPLVVGDFDASGVFDTGDINGFSQLLAGGGPASGIPEPTSVWLASVGIGLAILGRRRVRRPSRSA